MSRTAEELAALEALGISTIKDRTDQAMSLIAGLQITDPKLYEALALLAGQIQRTTTAISPIQTIISRRAAAAALLVPPTDFAYSFTPTTIRLSWTRPAISGLLSYEVRKGAAWDTADFVLRTQSTVVDVVPFSGLTGTYRIKTLNDEGIYSAAEATVDVVIAAPGPVSITGEVIDNNILLRWTSPTTGSFAIDYYNIERDSVIQGTVRGTFSSFFEVVAGTYLYTVTPVDIAGNVGSPAEVSLIVSQPPDYVLQDESLSTFDGTKTDVIKVDGPALLVNIPAETWEDHFTTRTWDHPQDQIDAGYPIYIQPAELTGSYEEVIDFGTVLSNVIATVRFNSEMLTAGSVAVLTKLAYSTDDITYTAFVVGASQFLPSMRYLKLRLEFTSSAETVVMRVFNLITTIAVKRENDGGEVSAISTDAGGTTVNFNKDFKDVESITATVLDATAPFVAVIDFVDIPDPVSFKVLVFNAAGARASKTVEWKARGVV